MTEPENQTLRVLIEFRNEFRQLKSDAEQRFARIEDRLEILTQSFSGMLGGIQGRFENVERRLAALERNR